MLKKKQAKKKKHFALLGLFAAKQKEKDEMLQKN